MINNFAKTDVSLNDSLLDGILLKGMLLEGVLFSFYVSSLIISVWIEDYCASSSFTSSLRSFFVGTGGILFEWQQHTNILKDRKNNSISYMYYNQNSYI